MSSTGSAIYAETDSPNSAAAAVYGTTTVGNALLGVATASGGYGVEGESVGGIGVLGTDASSGNGVYGYSDSGSGVVGASNTGNAGYFDGPAVVTGTLTVGSTVYSSDKNLKTDMRQIDSKDLLARLSQLEISSWNYKSDPKKRHVGPMAQDFHAAFGLNGSDETHISEVDIAGVSLAAIQELDRQMKTKDTEMAAVKAHVNEQLSVKDAQIAELNALVVAQIQAMAQMQASFSARMTALEHQQRIETTQTALLTSHPN